MAVDMCSALRRVLFRLQGARAGQWSVRISGNWRVVFRFEDDEAVDVEIVDHR